MRFSWGIHAKQSVAKRTGWVINDTLVAAGKRIRGQTPVPHVIFSIALSMSIRTHFRVVLAIWLLVIAVWIVLPGRNTYGNPWMEELVDSCTTSDGTKVRLYLGSGFLTAFWYSVTTEAGLFSLERQILYVYSGPELHTLACADRQLSITAETGPIVIPESELPALRKSPRNYSSAESGAWSMIGYAISVLLAAMAFAVAPPIRLRGKAGI